MQGTFKSRSWWSGSRALDILTFQIIFSHSHPCYFPVCVFDNIHCLAVTCFFFFTLSCAHTCTHTAETSKNKMFKGDQNCPHHDITNENFYTARFNLLLNAQPALAVPQHSPIPASQLATRTSQPFSSLTAGSHQRGFYRGHLHIFRPLTTGARAYATYFWGIGNAQWWCHAYGMLVVVYRTSGGLSRIVVVRNS